jgi:hypothetical protein
MAQGIKFTKEQGKDLVDIANQVAKDFTKGDWLQIGYSLGFIDQIKGHRRLLTSLYFRDDDYEGCVLDVLAAFAHADAENLSSLKAYLSDKYGTPQVSEFVSTAHTEVPRKMITFAPQVFSVPDKPQNDRLVTVMFPFRYMDTYAAIKGACDKLGLECLKGDDIWNNSTILQDIFELIFSSRVVIADFTDRNPNVFYEVGIAHTLGKTLIPITQTLGDVPSDLAGHRALVYHNNAEGRAQLAENLEKRLNDLFPSQLPAGL